LNLEKLVSSGSAPARKLRRARILLKSDCSDGGPNWTCEAICAAFDVNATTVTNVRKAFVEGGLEKALNRKKPEREYPHRLDGEAEAHPMALAVKWQALGRKKRKADSVLLSQTALYLAAIWLRVRIPPRSLSHSYRILSGIFVLIPRFYPFWHLGKQK
jgi:hypothetical protein